MSKEPDYILRKINCGLWTVDSGLSLRIKRQETRQVSNE